jgi:hypothetical protein
LQDTRRLLDAMRDGQDDCKDWFVQPHLTDLFTAEYRVLVTGVSGSGSEQCFPTATGWKDDISAEGLPVSNMAFQQMVANDDFYIPRSTTGLGVVFENQASRASREALFEAAKRVRAVLAANPVCTTARNVLLRVDVARVFVEFVDRRESWKIVCVVNEPNGLVLSAALGVDTCAYPEVVSVISDALRVEVKRRLRVV